MDTNALSALNIVCPIINLIVGLGTMLATGGSAIVARKMGAGEQQKAAQDFTLIISAGVFLGVLIAVVGTAFIDRIVWGLGASGILFPYCKEYLFVLLLFTPASILQVLFQNLIVTAGRPGMGMVLGVSAGIANILLDYIFMVPLQMGIKGAAFGTGIFVRVTKQIPAIGRYGGALVLLKLNYWLNLAIRHNGLFYKKKKQRKKKMNDLNPLSQDFTIKSLLKFAFPTILMMIFMGL